MKEIKDIHGKLIMTVESDTLTRAIFDGLDLSGADFRGADLRYAKFIRCKVDGADFRGADMLAASLVWTDFRTAVSDKTTKMPASLPSRPHYL